MKLDNIRCINACKHPHTHRNNNAHTHTYTRTHIHTHWMSHATLTVTNTLDVSDVQRLLQRLIVNITCMCRLYMTCGWYVRRVCGRVHVCVCMYMYVCICTSVPARVGTIGPVHTISYDDGVYDENLGKAKWVPFPLSFHSPSSSSPSILHVFLREGALCLCVIFSSCACGLGLQEMDENQGKGGQALPEEIRANLEVTPKQQPRRMRLRNSNDASCCTCSAARACAMTLQHTATHFNTPQHTATHCSKLQHTAAYCNTLRYFVNVMTFINTKAGACATGRYGVTIMRGVGGKVC